MVCCEIINFVPRGYLIFFVNKWFHNIKKQEVYELSATFSETI